MKKTIERCIESLPDVLQPGARLCFDRLPRQGDEIPDEFVAATARLFACSEFAGRTVARDTDWFVGVLDSLSAEGGGQALGEFAAEIANGNADIDGVKSQLRRFRNRFMLGALWREVQQQADLDETLQALSRLADTMLDVAMQRAAKELDERYGRVRNEAGEIVPLLVIGMGKLGGCELNFSSDIDIIFCYPVDGETDGARRISAQEYFTRLSRLVIALLDEKTADGFVFRVDTRLRPFGDSGPPVVSFAALESYLLQHGRDWERYAYVKARIAGSSSSAISTGRGFVSARAGSSVTREPS